MIDRLKQTNNRTTIIQKELMTLLNTVRWMTKDLYDITFMYSKYLLIYTALVNQRITADISTNACYRSSTNKIYNY